MEKCKTSDALFGICIEIGKKMNAGVSLCLVGARLGSLKNVCSSTWVGDIKIALAGAEVHRIVIVRGWNLQNFIIHILSW